jgi:hypothetical protein
MQSATSSGRGRSQAQPHLGAARLVSDPVVLGLLAVYHPEVGIN